MHRVLFPIAIAFARFVRNVDPFQIFAISSTGIAWHDASHRVPVRSWDIFAIHLERYNDIAVRINCFVKGKRTAVLIATLVVVVPE